MNYIKQALEWVKNNKTYTTVAVAVGIGAYMGYTGHDVPNYVYLILGAAGIGFTRSGIASEVAAAVADIKTQVAAK